MNKFITLFDKLIAEQKEFLKKDTLHKIITQQTEKDQTKAYNENITKLKQLIKKYAEENNKDSKKILDRFIEREKQGIIIYLIYDNNGNIKLCQTSRSKFMKNAKYYLEAIEESDKKLQNLGTKKIDEFVKEAKAFSDGLPFAQIAAVCDTTYSIDDLYVYSTDLFSCKGNKCGHLTEAEIDNYTNTKRFQTELKGNESDLAKNNDAVHPAMYANILQNLMTNDYWKNLSDNQKKRVKDVYIPVRDDAIALTEKYKEFFKNAKVGPNFNTWKARISKDPE